MSQKDVTVSIIAARARNHVIGAGNTIPWHIPDDFKHFKRTTMGKPLVMGRKTFESIGGKPLPGRPHIVVTRQADMPPMDHVTYVSSLETAIEMAKKIAWDTGMDEIFIAGGAQIYTAAMALTDRLYLTIIDRDFEGDAFFPPIDSQDWTETSRSGFTDPTPYDIVVLERRP